MVSMELLHGAVTGVRDIHAYRPTIQLLVAYIDPGSGTLMLQMAIAAAIGLVASLRKVIITLVSRLSDRNKPNPTRTH